MTAVQRFLRYIRYDTQSDEASETIPSTEKQRSLGALIAQELRELGLEGVELDGKGYVYAFLPATPGQETAPTIALLAHLDTAPGVSGEHVQPRQVPCTGEDIVLNEALGVVMETAVFPDLLENVGKTLIVTDGTTLLGADDKAGVAEIMTLCERLMAEELPHGRLCIAFTPDEEIGEGPDHFDVAAFGAKYAYTVDGGAAGSIEYENFNAATAIVDITGVSVHPGTAKDVMENALLLAQEVNALLPPEAVPAKTEGYQGFFHLDRMEGTAAGAWMEYIIRDHDKGEFTVKKALLERAAAQVQAAHPTAKIQVTVKDSYYNMKEKLTDCMHLIDNAKKAAELAGVVPTVEPIRGGTDGARLSYMGLPCPNLGTGSYNFHGPQELACVEEMNAVVDILVNIVALYAK